MAKTKDRPTPVGSASHDRSTGWRNGVSPVVVLMCLLSITFALLGSADAFAANRSLTLFNTHTKETTTIVYKRNGKFDANGLRKLNRFLRDWRRNESTTMDPALFDLLWQIYKDTGAKKPIHVVSGYRSPATNKMLRSRSRGVARNSRHTKGQAIDFYLPGVKTSTIRNAGLRLQSGGVGYYPTSRSPFVHIDTGNVRHWPRMSRKQLARVFPNGNTVHVPRGGKPLKGYEAAKAKVAKRKAEMVRASRSVKRFKQVAKAAPAVRKTKKSAVEIAKATQTEPQENGSLIRKLLNRTPKEPPKPSFETAQATSPAVQAETEATLDQAAKEAETDPVMPVKLATLPKSPLNRPQTASEPEPQEAITEAQTTAGDNLALASLPKARVQPPQPASSQLASAEPLMQPGAETSPEIGKKAVSGTPSVASPKTVAASAAANEKTGQGQPAESATEILNRLAQAEKAKEATIPSNRVAYASTDGIFAATLPSVAPRPKSSSDETKAGLDRLPKQADRSQTASLSTDGTDPGILPKDLAARGRKPVAKTEEPEAQKPADIDRLARLTFAYGPSGMSHFAHMKQSTSTATFARLSRPIPNNLAALVSKPDSIINQSFSHRPSQLISAEGFAGRAIERMAVRSFN